MKQNKILTNAFFHLFLINYCFFTSLACFQILPIHLKDIGATNLYIGIFMNLNALELIFIVFFMKKIFNNFSEKSLLIFGFTCSLFSTGLMFLFSNNLITLMILNIFSGFSFVFGFTLLFSRLYDIIPIEKRIGGAAIFGISGIISNPTGAFLGEFFYKNFEAKYIFILSSIFSLIALLLILFLNDKVKEKINTNVNIIKLIHNNNLLILIFFSLILGGAYGIFSSFIPEYTKQKIGITNITIFFTSFAVIASCTRIFLFRFLDRISSKLLIITALISMFISMTGLLFLKYIWELFIIGFLYGISHSILFPTLSTLFVNKAKFEKEKIVFNNIFLMFYNSGLIFFSSILGLASDIFSLFFTFLSMSIIILIGITYGLIMKSIPTSD